NGDVFSYVTGGLAYGKVDLEGTSTVSGTIANCAAGCPLGFSTTHAIGHSNINTRWTLGYGTEGRFAGVAGGTWRVETYYMDLGHLNDTDVPGCPVGGVQGYGCHRWANHHEHPFHRLDPSRRAELSIPLI